MLARAYGLSSAQLFQWRIAYMEGYLVPVAADESVFPAFDLQDAMRQIKQLDDALDSKTLENDILKEAVGFAKTKKRISRSPVMPADEK